MPKDLDAVTLGACPVIGTFGGRDRGLGQRAATRLDVALTRHGVEHEVHVYPRAGHSFLNDAPTGPRLMGPVQKVLGVGPEPESARQAWAAIESFLTGHLVAPPSTS